jgi:hypothetical protein
MFASNLQRSLMDVNFYGIEDLSAFSDQELRHIRVLYRMKFELEMQNKANGLNMEKSEKLKALTWLFKVLSEVSVED